VTPKRFAPKAALLLALVTLAPLACAEGEGGPEAAATDQVPDSFLVSLETSAGEIRMVLYRDWSPAAVERAYELIQDGFYDGARFYRVNDQYAQFGFSGRPALDSAWMPRRLPDEPVRASNERGVVTFARAGPASRNFVMFVNLTDNRFLDTWSGDGVAGFPPVGRVVGGLDVAERLHAEHGDQIVPLEDSILARGNAFLDERFPGLDSIVAIEILERW
jgi:peptidyl-prolyl cis-trans isomerase A (cyclophilin A)